jgi:PhnB protein
MGEIKVIPYLFFNGQCKQAMEFYQSLFDGDLKIQTMGEVPEEVLQQVSNPDKNRVMHAALEADGMTLMGSDSDQASDKTAKVELSLVSEDEARMRKIFDELSAGGEVRSPLKKQFWGDEFGSLTDKYGVDWMFNITATKQVM